MAKRLPTEHCHGLVVQDLEFPGVRIRRDDAVVAIGIVGIERHVGDDGDIGMSRFDGPDRSWHQALGIVTSFRLRGLQRLGDGGKQHHGFHPGRGGLTDFPHETVQAPAMATGHRFDCLVGRSFVKEEWVDEIGRGKGRLAHQPTNRGALSVPPGTDGKVHLHRFVPSV